MKLNKPIVLVGMMGAGKTTIGTRLSKKLNIPFIDTDTEVERIVNCSITDIFKYEGEEYFRRLEKKVVSEFLNIKPLILSTGGSTFVDDENRTLIKTKGTSIWLKAELDVLYERVSRKRTRPILEQGNKKELLTHLVEKFYPLYAEADYTIVSSNVPHNQVVDSIVHILEALYSDNMAV